MVKRNEMSWWPIIIATLLTFTVMFLCGCDEDVNENSRLVHKPTMRDYQAADNFVTMLDYWALDDEGYPTSVSFCWEVTYTSDLDMDMDEIEPEISGISDDEESGTWSQFEATDTDGVGAIWVGMDNIGNTYINDGYEMALTTRRNNHGKMPFWCVFRAFEDHWFGRWTPMANKTDYYRGIDMSAQSHRSELAPNWVPHKSKSLINEPVPVPYMGIDGYPEYFERIPPRFRTLHKAKAVKPTKPHPWELAGLDELDDSKKCRWGIHVGKAKWCYVRYEHGEWTIKEKRGTLALPMKDRDEYARKNPSAYVVVVPVDTSEIITAIDIDMPVAVDPNETFNMKFHGVESAKFGTVFVSDYILAFEDPNNVITEHEIDTITYLGVGFGEGENIRFAGKPSLSSLLPAFAQVYTKRSRIVDANKDGTVNMIDYATLVADPNAICDPNYIKE